MYDYFGNVFQWKQRDYLVMETQPLIFGYQTKYKIFISSFWTPCISYKNPVHIVRVAGSYTAIIHFLILMYCVDFLKGTDYSIPFGPFFEDNASEIHVTIWLTIIYNVIYLIANIILIYNGLKSNLQIALPWIFIASFDVFILIYYQLGLFSFITDFPTAVLVILLLVSYHVYCVWGVISCFMKLRYNEDIEITNKEIDFEDDFMDRMNSFRKSTLSLHKIHETYT